MNAVSTKGRRSVDREAAAEKLTHGTWEGTQELVLALTYESMHAHGWRPIRAAALAAVRDCAETSEIAMTAVEFEAWRETGRILAKARGDGNLIDRVGISPFQARTYAKEGAPKTVALACAHYLMGLPMPIAAGDARAFDEWYRPRFGGTERISQWLQISPAWLTVRLNGFELVKGVRTERTPPAYLIRALDWVANIGPVCPYGAKTALQVWPGQDLGGEDY